MDARLCVSSVCNVSFHCAQGDLNSQVHACNTYVRTYVHVCLCTISVFVCSKTLRMQSKPSFCANFNEQSLPMFWPIPRG